MNSMRKTLNFFYNLFLLFLLLAVLFIPFSFGTIQIQSKISQFLFEDCILWIGSNCIDMKIANAAITSDSISLYILVCLLFILATVLAIGQVIFNFSEKGRYHFKAIIQLIFVFYLSIIMFKYGFDKIFGNQFFSPEPNLLYTPIGLFDKDILYWSTIGTSYSYSFFLGILEILPATMLLFRKTRILGLLLLLGVLIHVLAINLCFDISVKLFSSFLLLLVFFLLFPTFKSLFQFFIMGKMVQLSAIPLYNCKRLSKIKFVMKVIFVGIIFFECLYPNFKKTNNDLKFKLFGAYEVIEITDLSSKKSVQSSNIKRVFFHKQNYFIVQYHDDSTQDFYFETSQNSSELTLISYNGKRINVLFHFSTLKGDLVLEFIDWNIKIHSKAIAWEKLPLLQSQFHWTVDEVQ